MTDDIKELLKTLREGNVSKKLKLEIYAEIKKCLDRNEGTEAAEKQDLYVVVKDLVNSDDDIREYAWSILDLCKITVGSEIFNRLFKLVSDKNMTFQICTMVKETLISSLKDQVKEPDFKLDELLIKYHNEAETITTLFIEMCKSFSKTETADFLYYKLFPFIFNTENEELRDAAIEIGMGIISFNTLVDLDLEKQKAFLASIENEYILSIRNVFGKMKQPNWHKMFILLLRYGGIIFHQRVDITNAILKIAEGGFKSSLIDNKLYAFDCWKELINNYSLNLKHMTMPKHMKLLVTPLKANLSSNETVVHKRFDVWIHLLKKLGDKAVICLEQFLNFCFGPLGANPLVAVNNPGIASPGKKVVRLWNKSPKFLLEVLGHYGHNSNDPCVNCEEELKLEKSILNNSNFQTIYTPVIHSIGESCLILSKWTGDVAEISRVIHCMWGSLLNFINALNSDIKEKVLQVVSNQVLALSKVAENDSDYIDTILMPIINTIMDFQCSNTDDSLFKPVLVPSLKYLNTTGKLNTTRLRRSMDVAFSSKRNFVKVRMFGEFCDLITEIEKVKLSYPLWITLSHFVPDLCCTCPINEVFSGYLLSFMLWPVNNFHCIPDGEKENLINIWKKLMEEICKNSALVHKNHHNFQTSIVHSFQKIMKKNPLAINSVSLFLPLLSLDSLKNEGLDTLFISDLLQLILDLLDCPFTSKDNISKLTVILSVCINDVLKHPHEKADLIYEKLFKAIQYFLQPHQMYGVLDKLENILSEDFISKKTVPPALKSLVTDLTLHKDSEISRSAIKILSLLESTAKDDTLKSSSENFIENSNSLLLKSSAKKKSTKPTFIENTRVIQQLLEANISPVKLKGSQLKNSPKSSKTSTTPRSPSTTKKLPSGADKKETYVVIENNYKFDKRKLTEHQKEKMRKRREDIPALYQDLSQSQASNSQSNSQDDVLDKDIKVIVERIPSLKDTTSIFQNQNSDLTERKGNTSFDDMQQMELVINETNKTEQKNKDNVQPSNEDIFAGTNPVKGTNNSAELPAKEIRDTESVKRIKRINTELSRLKMNIVGGDISINVNEERKSRRSSKPFDKTNSPFVFEFESDEPTETPKSKRQKVQRATKNAGKTKRKNTKAKTDNSNDTSEKEITPKRKYRKQRSQSLTDNNDEALDIKNRLKRRTRSNSDTKEYKNNNTCSGDGHIFLKDQNTDLHSEDIIESSQDSVVSIGKSFCRTFSNSNQVAKSTKSSIADGEIQPVFNDPRPKSPQSDDSIRQPNKVVVQSEKIVDLSATQITNFDANDKLKETEKELKSDTIIISEDFSPDRLIRKDLDEIERKPSKREIEIAEVGTESLPVDSSDYFETCPEKLEPSSEHKIENQKEEEIIEDNNAMEVEKEEKTPSLFDSEPDSKKDSEANLQEFLDEDPKMVVDTENKSKIVQQQPSSRSARLVGLVTATNSPQMNPFIKRKSDAISLKTASTIFSPKTSRIRKMMQNCEDQKPLFVIDLEEETKEKIPENQLLQFSREVPSPLATPKGSILKRKRELNDHLSDDNIQSTKRKRVNFSDPPTTCKKVFIQHQDELTNRYRGIKKNLLLTTKLPTKEVGTTTTLDENDHHSVVVVEEQHPEATDQEVPSESSSSKEIIDIEMSQECDKIDINDDTVEDNADVEIVEDSSLLDDVVPICPDLTDCLDNVEVISNKLSSSLSKSELLEELNKNNIYTIGDLAFLTEKKINALCLNPPKMNAVKRALSEYKEAKNIEEMNEINNGVIGQVIDILDKTISPENTDVMQESDLNSTNVVINGQPNELQSRELNVDSDEDDSKKGPEKRIAILDNFLLRPAYGQDVQISTSQNQPHCSFKPEVSSCAAAVSVRLRQTEGRKVGEVEQATGINEPREQLDEIERLIKGTTEENLQQFFVLAIDKLSEENLQQFLTLGINKLSEENLQQFLALGINKLSEFQNSHFVLKRLIGTTIEKMPRSASWDILIEYLTKLFRSDDCD